MVDRKRVPAHLHARYGIRPYNKPLLGVIAVATIAVVTYVALSIGQHSSRSSEVRLISWEATSPSKVAVSFSVARTVDEPLLCVLRAQDQDRFDVGYALARIDHPTTQPTFSVVLTTRSAAYTVTEPICDVPDSAALIGSHFRPGQLPPAQSGGLFAPWQDITASLD